MKLSVCHDQWVINDISLPSPIDGKESFVHERSTSVCRHMTVQCTNTSSNQK